MFAPKTFLNFWQLNNLVKCILYFQSSRLDWFCIDCNNNDPSASQLTNYPYAPYVSDLYFLL